MDKLTGLSLFSGIGGIDLALKPWVRTIAYCEKDTYCQAVLLSRMRSGDLDIAPIWDDVQTLNSSDIKGVGKRKFVDIIYGGFPCQDISVAGHGAGLEGKRSGLFFEILRLSKGIKPTFLFLENVPAIRTRGLGRVTKELSDVGYNCRWGSLSAYEMGAPHKRERWFLLGYSKHNGLHGCEKTRSDGKTFNNRTQSRLFEIWELKRASSLSINVAHTSINSLEKRRLSRRSTQTQSGIRDNSQVDDTLFGRQMLSKEQVCSRGNSSFNSSWWKVKPDVGWLLSNGISIGLGEIDAMQTVFNSFGKESLWSDNERGTL